jgi:hypothetical protein
VPGRHTQMKRSLPGDKRSSALRLHSDLNSASYQTRFSSARVGRRVVGPARETHDAARTQPSRRCYHPPGVRAMNASNGLLDELRDSDKLNKPLRFCELCHSHSEEMAQEATVDPAEAVRFAIDSDPEGRYPKEVS